jgi:hypothetical protein
MGQSRPFRCRRLVAKHSSTGGPREQGALRRHHETVDEGLIQTFGDDPPAGVSLRHAIDAVTGPRIDDPALDQQGFDLEAFETGVHGLPSLAAIPAPEHAGPECPGIDRPIPGGRQAENERIGQVGIRGGPGRATVMAPKHAHAKRPGIEGLVPGYDEGLDAGGRSPLRRGRLHRTNRSLRCPSPRIGEACADASQETCRDDGRDRTRRCGCPHQRTRWPAVPAGAV